MLLAGRDALQLISDDSKFNERVRLIGDADSTRYNVVSIIGAQSGGKSTLLNTMCGTTFQTMDSDPATIHQTTRGVWLSEDPKAPLLILDIEGTDSSERNKEGDRAFERHSGVFALALSDTVLINVNYQDINREHGSGLPLFEELQRAYLKHFHDKYSLKAKPRIIVVLRDYQGRPAPNNMKAQIHEKLQERWETVARSYQMEGLKLSDVFNVGVQLMSHYGYARDQFRAECVMLRNQILAQDPLVSARNLTLGSFIPFASSAWRIIGQISSLNVPTVGELLCNYSIDEALKQLLSRIKSKSYMELFGNREAITIFNDALEAFDKSSYGMTKIGEKLEIYVESLFAQLRDPAEAYIFKCGKAIIRQCINNPEGNMESSSIEEYIRRFESYVSHTTFEVRRIFRSRNYSYIKEFQFDSEEKLRRFRDLVWDIHKQELKHRDDASVKAGSIVGVLATVATVASLGLAAPVVGAFAGGFAATVARNAETFHSPRDGRYRIWAKEYDPR
eukprot:Blabericola_migrator_1__6803@NODE_3444_length_1773_cov_30_315358_g2142_i0_p1_GENE_NODE_3444_length_1773_cov_30_315358_g2142_i0NODE_3444_length_1773_cov_30_315358_g2142_i0_p1_ORF_typecomplete_len505_score85_37RHD3/PF05879_12/4_8e44GBP/PF02263_19/1_1e14MMR_HSR1/PF01926_23/1_6e06Dynamin_N/PF00350_23/0_00047IIGP/PF05049_13/0_00098Roc/PF08477_13/0_15Roc/PF08477_13/1e03Septin/PF00735_18/0_071DUF87/PF01935_17/0_94ApoL/PF05461_11/0_27RsgA_GTPase/PF03193_16/0_25AAA_28/PF13521_6/0_34FeoB_N/PF02421_18/0_29